MYLTKEEERMLSGECGVGTQRAMSILVSLGDVMGAKRMIKSAGSHIWSYGLQGFGDVAKWNREFNMELLENVEHFRIPTTVNPKFVQIERKDLCEKLGLSKSFVESIQRSMRWSMEKFKELGAIPTYSCTPFFMYPVRRGEHLTTSESVAVTMYNSIYGAMVNRETQPTALSSAITGRTPEFGMHIPENRYGRVLFRLDEDMDPEKFTYADYSALGYYAGKIAMDRNVIFEGIPKNVTVAQLKHLLAPLGVSGAVCLAHVVGVTPEASKLEDALLGREPEEEVTIGQEKLKQIYNLLNSADEREINAVAFGCPHSTLEEVMDIARLLKNRRVKDGVTLLVGVPETVRVLAGRMGLVDIIEGNGGFVVSDMCPGTELFGRKGQDIGVHTVATNCAKCAHYIPGHSSGKINVWFGNSKACVDAAVEGKWGSA